MAGCGGLTERLAKVLADCADYEAQLVGIRVWAKEWHFRIGVHHLRGLDRCGYQRCAICRFGRCCGRCDVARGGCEFARKHGPMPGVGAVVLGMGSLGRSG